MFEQRHMLTAQGTIDKQTAIHYANSPKARHLKPHVLKREKLHRPSVPSGRHVHADQSAKPIDKQQGLYQRAETNPAAMATKTAKQPWPVHRPVITSTG